MGVNIHQMGKHLSINKRAISCVSRERMGEKERKRGDTYQRGNFVNILPCVYNWYYIWIALCYKLFGWKLFFFLILSISRKNFEFCFKCFNIVTSQRVRLTIKTSVHHNNTHTRTLEILERKEIWNIAAPFWGRTRNTNDEGL